MCHPTESESDRGGQRSLGYEALGIAPRGPGRADELVSTLTSRFVTLEEGVAAARKALMTNLFQLQDRNDSPNAPAEKSCRLLMLMDHSLDFIELLGRKGIIEGVSSAITSLAGYEPKDLIGQQFHDLVHPEDRAAADRALAEVVSLGRTGPVKLRYRSRDGTWRTVIASARNYLTDPATSAIVILTRDVTDQLLAERSLETANEELRRLSLELLGSQEAERAHLARELHDDIGQALAGLGLTMLSAAPSASGAVAGEMVSTWRRQIQEILAHLRALTENLHPLALTKLGLAGAIKAHVERLRLISGINIQLDVSTELGRLAAGVELNCFRIVQEALNNALKHSGARTIWVTVIRIENDLHVKIRDDGGGFDVSAAHDGVVAAGSVGLLSMKERASLTGGQLEIDSEPGHGTCVTGHLPCEL